jgi:hypothetical protein
MTNEIRRILEMVVIGTYLAPSDRRIVLDYLLQSTRTEKDIYFVSSSNIGVPTGLFNEVKQLLQCGVRETYNCNAIEAIKHVRVNLGVGLKEAKDIVTNPIFGNYKQSHLGPLPVTPCVCRNCKTITNRKHGEF